MSQPGKLLAAACLAAGLLLPGAAQAIGANSAPSTNVPNSPATGTDNTRAAVDAETERLLKLMDTDKNGKVSKQEFMQFMEAEFDRLDVNKDGQLDVGELTRLKVKPGVGAHK